MKKIINPWRNHPGYNCLGCCPDNPIMQHDIAKHGFTYCGIIYLASGAKRLAYQKK